MNLNEDNDRLVEHIREVGYLKSKKIEEAMRKYKREFFIPKDMKNLAYRDTPLSMAGFPVTLNWNGKEDTKLAVKSIEMKLIKPKDKITVKSNQKFFNALNNYLDKVRKSD